MLELLFAAAVALGRLPAPEARQGVAVDAAHVYAVDNSVIAKYDRRTGVKLAVFKGGRKKFRHTNACVVLDGELLCAVSNYPKTPMVSKVAVFDPGDLKLKRIIPLEGQPGSITWIDRYDGSWWAGFANYDGRGGVPGRDHRATVVVRFDDNWREEARWTFPPEVLARFAPYSNSGGAIGDDGRLYATGHNSRRLYVLEFPEDGEVLNLVATIKVPVRGQAVTFDRTRDGVMYGVNRKTREIVAFRLPAEIKWTAD